MSGLPKGAVPASEYRRRQARPRAAGERPDYAGILMYQIAGSDLDLEVEREHRFHPTRKWRLDLAIFRGISRQPSVAVEIEGGIWAGAGDPAKRAHAMPLAIVRDMVKHNEAALLGWRVLRVLPEWIATPDGEWRSDALALVERALKGDMA